jgi:hypothetical protein
MTRKFSSTSVSTTLASGINSSATSIVVATGTGAALMGGVTLAPGNVDSFAVALDVDTINEEIVWVTNISGDTLTVVRAEAGTTAIAHTAGATVKHVLTGDDATFFTAGVATANAAIPESVVTAKGDLLVADTSGSVDNLAVGANDAYLVADSTATLGVKWGTSASVVTLTGTQTLTNKTLTTPVATVNFNAQTGTTYTFVLSDASKFVTCSNASAIAVSIPTNASVAFPIGTIINVQQIGAGQVTIAALTPGTTTVTSAGTTAASPKTRVQYSAATCIKTGTDTWTVVGDIA